MKSHPKSACLLQRSLGGNGARSLCRNPRDHHRLLFRQCKRERGVLTAAKDDGASHRPAVGSRAIKARWAQIAAVKDERHRRFDVRATQLANAQAIVAQVMEGKRSGELVARLAKEQASVQSRCRAIPAACQRNKLRLSARTTGESRG
jgi:O6-methylguanine-DNA--protein-cysteine methyltransferase